MRKKRTRRGAGYSCQDVLALPRRVRNKAQHSTQGVRVIKRVRRSARVSLSVRQPDRACMRPACVCLPVCLSASRKNAMVMDTLRLPPVAAKIRLPRATSRRGSARVGRGNTVAFRGVDAYLLEGHVEERPASAAEQHPAFFLHGRKEREFQNKGHPPRRRAGFLARVAAIPHNVGTLQRSTTGPAAGREQPQGGSGRSTCCQGGAASSSSEPHSLLPFQARRGASPGSTGNLRASAPELGILSPHKEPILDPRTGGPTPLEMGWRRRRTVCSRR